MPVIAMTREMGSGGREIAHLVAERMGLTVILHELVEHDLAEHIHVRESTIHRCLEGGATADGGRIVLTGVAIHDALAADAGKLAAEVAGVREVVNRIVVVHGPRGLR